MERLFGMEKKRRNNKLINTIWMKMNNSEYKLINQSN